MAAEHTAPKRGDLSEVENKLNRTMDIKVTFIFEKLNWYESEQFMHRLQ